MTTRKNISFVKSINITLLSGTHDNLWYCADEIGTWSCFLCLINNKDYYKESILSDFATVFLPSNIHTTSQIFFFYLTDKHTMITKHLHTQVLGLLTYENYQ